MVLKLFQTTVMEYKRFTQQLPIDYTEAMSGEISDSVYVAVHTRLMLLRKYTKKGQGSQYLADVANEASRRFPEHHEYLSEFQQRFQHACDQSLNHVLSDGTNRTLDETISDTMYGLHLHADASRIDRIRHDSELLRLYCIVIFVKEIETLLLELFDFFEEQGVKSIEIENHSSAPVIHLESKSTDEKNITGSPFWKNLIGHDMTDKDLLAQFGYFCEQYSPEEMQLWMTASKFADLLSRGSFSLEEMREVVFEPTIRDWGDFSDAVRYYRAIPSPGITTTIRYNDKRNTAYIHIHSHVEQGFIVDAPQIVTNTYTITLVKDPIIGEWRVFALGKPVDPTKQQ